MPALSNKILRSCIIQCVLLALSLHLGLLLQPWDRDNVKLFYIWLFVASGFNAVTLLRPFLEALGNSGKQASRDQPASNSTKASLFIVPTLLFLMMTTGILSYVREAGNNHILYGRDEIAVRAFQYLGVCCWG